MVLLKMTPCSLMDGYRGSRRSMLSPSSGHACSTFCKLHNVITHRSQYDYEDLDSVKGREFIDQSREYKRRIVVPRVDFTSRNGTKKVKPEASCGRSRSTFLSWALFARLTNNVLRNFQTSKTGIMFGTGAIVEFGRLKPLHTLTVPLYAEFFVFLKWVLYLRTLLSKCRQSNRASGVLTC